MALFSVDKRGLMCALTLHKWIKGCWREKDSNLVFETTLFRIRDDGGWREGEVWTALDTEKDGFQW